MANNFFGAIALIGGAAGALDAIDGTGLVDLDAAFVQVGGQVYLYTLDASSGAAESSPETISPDTNAGTKRWILQSLNVGMGDVTNPGIAFGAGASGFYEIAANRISLSINGARTTNFEAGFIESATGTCWRLEHEASSYTNPVFVNAADQDTGMGFGAATKTLSLIANSIEALRVTENGAGAIQVILPLQNNPTLPSLAFGDGNTGIYEESDNVMAFGVSGAKQSGVHNGWGIRAAASNGGGLKNETATATNPSFVGSYGDVDTGMGWGGADILTLVAGGIEGLRVVEDTTVQVIFPLQNDAAKPSLAFGDGDTGIYETIDDSLNISLAGAANWQISTSYMGSSITGRARMSRASTSAIQPGFLPGGSTDSDTGVGTAGLDILSLTAGAIEGIRITEAASVITNRASDNLDLSNTAEGNVGSIGEKTTREVHTLTLGASSVTTTITIPTGAMLLGVSFNVNDTVTDTAGDDTWSAAFSGGSTATLATAAAAAIDTKVNTLIVPEIASGATEITFTPNGGNFGAGIIEVVAYYKSLTSLGDV